MLAPEASPQTACSSTAVNLTHKRLEGEVEDHLLKQAQESVGTCLER